MAVSSKIPGEEYYPIAIGQGMYTAELPTNIPDGFSAICYNMVASGDSLENRIGFRQSTLAWRVQEASPGDQAIGSDGWNYFCELFPWENDSNKPAFAWGAKGYANPAGTSNSATVNMVRAAGTGTTGDGFLSFNVGSNVLGFCQYNNVIYYSLAGNGIWKITPGSINWITDVISPAPVQLATTGTGTLKGIFTFKDRIWGWGAGASGHSLYFTDLPTVGGLPETWAFASNVIPIVGPNGYGRIMQIVPLGNKLAIFTTNGFFTLLVEGAPGSWILRILDSRSISTCSQCAFESKGLIYYINTQGVWATNNLSSTKMSAVIEDQFFLAKGARIHTICPYEDGMVVSVGKEKTGSIRYFDRDNCKVFYSKLDPVGWTEWNVNSYELGSYAEKLVLVWSMTNKIPTFLNTDPTVYTMAFFSDSTEAAPANAVAQVLVMDGGNDEYTNRSGTARTQAVGIYLKTKHFDGGNQYNLKQAKKAMVEIFTSDAEHNFTTSWDIDETIDSATEKREVLLNDYVVGTGSNLIQIRNQFYYRRASLNLRATLQTADSQIKIKDITMAQNTGRGEFEQVR